MNESVTEVIVEQPLALPGCAKHERKTKLKQTLPGATSPLDKINPIKNHHNQARMWTRKYRCIQGTWLARPELVVYLFSLSLDYNQFWL